MKKITDKFLSHLENERAVSPHTHKNYQVDLQQFFQFVESKFPGFVNKGEECLKKLDVSFVREYVESRWSSLSASSMARKLASLRTFFNYCIREKLVLSNPAKEIATPKVPKRVPKFLTVDEVFALIDAAKDEGVLGARDRAILELLYASGLRVSELVGLNIENVDLKAGTVRVVGKGRKERIVPIGEKASVAISKYIEKRSALVLDQTHTWIFANRHGGRLTVRSVERLIPKYIHRSGLQKTVTPHVLRHTFATHLIGAGADMRGIQELLGHTSLSTTQKYTHVGIENLMATYDKTHPKA